MILLLALAVGITTTIFILRSLVDTTTPPAQSFPTPTIYQPPSRGELFIQAQNISELKKASIGITTEDDLKQIPNIIQNGNIYTHPSPLIPRPNELIVENGVVVFEQVLIPEEQDGPNFKSISMLKSVLGEPDGSIQGSAYYGWYIETLIYPQLGLAAIVNPYTDEVFELHFFEPTTIEGYTSKFGKDIQEHTGDTGPEHP